MIDSRIPHRALIHAWARHILIGAIVLVAPLYIVADARPVSTGQTSSLPIILQVDATDATRGIFHGHLRIPVAAGPLTLLYPEWLPGEHGPTGPVLELTGLKMAVKDTPVAWERDSVDMFAFHVDIPAGADTLDVRLDYISPSTTIAANGYGFSPNATAKLADILWNHLLLYPQGRAASDVMFRATLRLPRGWNFGTALPIEKQTVYQIDFSTASLETLVDSPVIAGEYFKVVPLASDPTVEIDIAADSAAALQVSPDQIEHYKLLVKQAYALFGAHHYRDYHFLLTLSDIVSANGLEHHESSDDRTAERVWLDDDLRAVNASLLPHEYTHSWNGKYRRPSGLATANFNEPMKGNLLWVYEGMTQYIGDVLLTGRSGLYAPRQMREFIAWDAALMDNTIGRTWRPLRDTATAAQILYGAPEEWAAFRRGVDFYDEGLLIWLEADATIRKESKGRKSLDDFCRAFHGGQNSGPELKPYTFEDLVAGLNSVLDYDWAGFLKTRLTSLAPHAPLGGIETSGWKLVYNQEPNWFIKAREKANKYVDLSYSLGMNVKTDGTVADVIPGSAAFRAGLAPGMKVIAVNGRRFSEDVLRDAVRESTLLRAIEFLAD
ncbi:MAG TPA: M61 family peptidase, partial [Blastocatellia bacterium]|nr:M61 family peptidase [Blastocatellia bacterium]